METNLFDRMLSAYMTEQTSVTLTLQNKIRVSGKVKAFDSYVVIMEGQKREILYRHAISSRRKNRDASSPPPGRRRRGLSPGRKRTLHKNPVRRIASRRSPHRQRKQVSTTA